MPFDLEAHSWFNTGLAGAAAAIGVAYIRERRKGRKDANQFALNLIANQSKRIDDLTLMVGELKGMVTTLSGDKSALLAENAMLRQELANAQAALAARSRGETGARGEQGIQGERGSHG